MNPISVNSKRYRSQLLSWLIGASGGMLIYLLLLQIPNLETALLCPAFFAFIPLILLISILPKAVFQGLPLINLNLQLASGISSIPFATLGIMAASRQTLPKRVARVAVVIAVLLSGCPGISAICFSLAIPYYPWGIEGTGIPPKQLPLFIGGILLVAIAVTIRHLSYHAIANVTGPTPTDADTMQKENDHP